MTISSSNIENALREIGLRVARIRLSRNQTQVNLASEAGASPRSIKRLEAGGNTSLDTLLRVFAALGLTGSLSDYLPDPDVRPVERIKNKGRERKRARPKAKAARTTDWAWGEEAEK